MASKEIATTLRESVVGILCYANTAPRFLGILKQRYTDFKVNEIDLAGNVAHLTDLHHHQFEEQANGKVASSGQQLNTTQDPDAKPTTTDNDHTSVQRSESEELQAVAEKAQVAEEVAKFKDLAGERNAEQLKAFMAAAAAYEDGHQERQLFPDPIFLDPDEDKEKRKALHDFFKKAVFAKVVSETMSRKNARGEMAGASSIRISYIPPKRKRPRRSNRMGRAEMPKDWAGGNKEYLQFVLYKDNLETQAVLGHLSKLLHISRSSFGVAGTKDRRASTVQHVTVKKVQPFRLAQQNSRLKGARVGNFEYVHNTLHLGSLSGNLFDLILRNVRGCPADVELAAEALKKSGFINYFGLQRFGHSASPTHMVGSQLLKGDWEAAVKLILAEREGDREDALRARQLFAQGQIGAANRAAPAYMQSEKAILQGLVEQGHSNYLAALRQIPRSMRNMYLHSFQSYLWNFAASHRVATHGVEAPVTGDLVLPKDTDAEPAGDEDADEPASRARLQQVHVLTEQDLEEGKYRIDDVVLPLPGSKTLLPQNSTAEVYQLEARKLGIELGECTHGVPDFSMKSLPGDYRRLLVRPRQLTWKLLLYSDLQQDLAFTDLDAVLQKQKPDIIELQAGQDVPENMYLALQLMFPLPVSCYATMLVRELTKSTTSNLEHREMTKADEVEAKAATTAP